MLYIYAVKRLYHTYVLSPLSKRPLTDAQILLLSKGLSFAPKPKEVNDFEFLEDFD